MTWHEIRTDRPHVGDNVSSPDSRSEGLVMFTQPIGRPVEILLVEDNPGDVELVREALAECGIPSSVNVVGDGDEALAYLRRQGAHAGAVPPDFMLLDLKLPKKGGLEVLAEMKASEAFRRIPVIVLSSSDAPEDVLRAYDLQASCYVTKPADLDEFERVMGMIRDFTLTVVKLPPDGPAFGTGGGERGSTSGT
jgi:chemotaxis family two-component system response regulator Rcp1